MKILDLKNINIKQVNSYDLENLFNIYTDEDGMYFYNMSKSVYFPEELDPNIYTEYIIQPKDMYYTISYKFYNTVKLWWIICSANQIDDPFKDINIGTILKIINKDIVAQILMQIKNS